MKVEIQIHPTEARHEFAKVDILFEELDARIPLDINFDPFLRFARSASPIALDFFLISAVVYAIDKAVSREGAYDRWTRMLNVTIPVQNPVVWNEAAGLLGQSLSFLTGDRWSFSFTQGTGHLIRRRANRRLKARGFPASPVVSLLSGGLDSFIGALDLLSDNPDRRIMFVSHYDGKVPGPASDQNRLEELLQARFPNRIRHMQMRIGILSPQRISCATGKEWQETIEFDPNFRSRSFAFLGIGVLAAQAIGAGTPVWIPENGPIALNMPLNPSRRGSCSTRTVHPNFLATMQRVLDAVEIDHFILNPYALKTKGEMAAECKAPEALAAGYDLTNSCAKTNPAHWEDQTANGCGRCVPCLFRRASLHAIGRDDEPYGHNVLKEAVDRFDDFYALLGLMRRNPGEAEIARSLLANGRLPIESLDAFVSVERRMIEEVRKWLSDKASPVIKKYVRIK